MSEAHMRRPQRLRYEMGMRQQVCMLMESVGSDYVRRYWLPHNDYAYTLAAWNWHYRYEGA